MTVKQLEKVSINELISLASYSIEQVTGEEIVGGAYGPNFNGDYEELLNYIDTNKQAMEDISDYEYTWLQVLVNGKLDLVTL